MPDCTKPPMHGGSDNDVTTPIIPDFEIIKHFLTRIDGAFDVKRGFNFVGEKGTVTAGKAQEQFWTFSELKSKLTALQKQGRAGFFFVNQSDTKGTTAKHITGLNTWVADVDFKSAKGYDKETNPEPFTLQELLAALPLAPHMVVFTGHGYHLYFLAAPDSPIDTRRDIQKRIAAKLETFGADKASLHLLRMPSTFNRKENGWKPVQLVHNAQHERYTIDEISAAFPEIQKPKKKSVTSKLPQINWGMDLYTDGDTQQDLYERTLRYVETAARGASDGNRHTTLNGLMPIICGADFSYSQMLWLVTRFNDLSGHDTNEAVRQLNDAIKANLGWISKLKNSRPNRKLQRLNTRLKPLPNRLGELDAIRSELKSKISGIMDAPTGMNHLIKVTVGVGKTRAVINDLRSRLLNPETWPKKPDGTEAQVLVCVDTKEQAKAFKDQLQRDIFFENDTPINEGRNSDNCWEHDKIAGSRLSGKYCITCIHNPRSGNYSGYSCPYMAKRIKVRPQKLIITPKAALLTDEYTEWGDILIIDEDVSQYLYQQEQYDEKRLRAYIELLSLHGGTGEAINWINTLIEDMNGMGRYEDKVPRYKMPELSPELIEQVESFSGNEMDMTTWKKADSFLSMLNGNYRLRVKHNHILVTREAVSNALILDNKTVINLDATPRECMLKPLDFEVTSFETKQNIEYYQFRTAKLTKRDLQNDTTREHYIAYIAELQRLYGNDLVAFTHKAFADEIRANETETGEYRVHSRGLNKYEKKRIMVTLGSYRENIGSVKDQAHVMGVDYRTLLRETDDAEMMQVVGRLRGVNAIQKKYVVILSSEQLPLDSPAHDLELEGGGLKTDFYIPETLTTSQEGHTLPYKNIDMNEAGLVTVNTGFQTFKVTQQTKKAEKTCKLTLFIQECLDTHGFFHPELIFGGSYFAPLGSAPDISFRTYKRRIKEVVKLGGLEVSTLDVGHIRPLSVYGSPDAASQHLLKPVESVPQKFTDTAKQELFSLWWTTGRYEDSDGMPLILSSEPLPDALSDYVEPHNNIWRVHDMFLAADFSGH